ncbi:hypothetical protein SAMN04488117_11540 [Celeribacter baekdonensis]|uniref:Uncharacterized protein n=1 Tax=Celeribacter baekdonensis TaxID=875171 RepID=A0A1G7SUI1_9RHOB|nr:hypothetical protein [Celeribacter baekdonensis]SDG26631.1 hypothetical protein SAMN04488117_11540 [Celeribacter baekdonensis]
MTDFLLDCEQLEHEDGFLESDVELPYKAVEQLGLLLKALDALHPFAVLGGIETSYDSANDEWEMIVEALYGSFIIQPIVDTQNVYFLQDFARIGFCNHTKEKQLRCLVEANGKELLLHDIGLAEDGYFKLLVFEDKGGGNPLLAIGGEELKSANDVRFVSSFANGPDVPSGFTF